MKSRRQRMYASSVSVYEVFGQTLEDEDLQVAELRATTIMKEFTIVDVDVEIAEEGAPESVTG
jgi:hypothetical protein